MDVVTLFKNYYNGILKDKQTHFIIRCPYCGDSTKNPNNAHLYINKTENVFYCVRCSTGGSLSRLLFKIKDRFKNFNVLDVLHEFQYISEKQYTLLNNKKLLAKNTEDIEYIRNWLLKENLFVQYDEDILLYPIARYNTIKKYLQEQNLEDGICYITKGNIVIYRTFYKLKNAFRFRTLHLNASDENRLRLSVFSTYKSTIEKYNTSANLTIKAIISESITDLIAYHINNREDAIYIATNGKYTDQLQVYLNKIDEIIYLVDSDAILPEIRFILKNLALKQKIKIYIPKNGLDYRTATQFEIVEI